MKVKFKKELPDAKMPYKKNNDDFCYDLYAATDAQPVYDDDGNLMPNVWCYDTGISYEIVRDNEELETVYRPDIEIPDIGTDEERKAFLESIENKTVKRMFNFKDSPVLLSLDGRPRSSCYKTGMILSNCEATLDEPYRGRIKVFFYHVITSLPKYKKGDRIIQVKIGFTLPIQAELTDEEWGKTSRGECGFGSTGKD